MTLNRYRLACLIAALLSWPAIAAAQEHVGSSACLECHAGALEAWKTSHHYQAMLPAIEENVLGDFSDRTFEYAGVTSRFYRRDGKFYVETDNREGKLQEFEIAWTFGFHPLQQYLVPFGDGRYQALNIVWDSRPENEGGQRWIHLYPDNPVTHEDPVHWTGSFQNWNSRCAACHSTHLRKNYEVSKDRYQTRWSEPNVACEACHGPASKHVEWAAGDRQAADRGFNFSLNDRGAFGPAGNGTSGTFSRIDGKRPTTQTETCAACHSRRSELQDFQPGTPFDEQYNLALITPGLYFPDGQINDEVYVYGSFLQSKMHQAGVVCTDCHDPHSNAVRADDNTLCTQCHSSELFDRTEHHHHPVRSSGSACVDCHMPARTYMVVDDRRDHSFRIPRPELTGELGVPNGCNNCHEDQSPQWALDATKDWGVTADPRTVQARAMDAAWSGQVNALPALLTIAGEPGNPAILRASALIAASGFPSRESYLAAQQMLSAKDPLLRAAAVRSLDPVPVAQRYAVLRDLITDGSKSVRMAVAQQLTEFPAGQLPGESGAELRSLLSEYLSTMQHNADMPEEQINLGVFHSRTGDPIAAEKAYRAALRLSPGYVPALLNLSDLYRENGLDDKAEPLLRQAVERSPGSAPPSHAMGLLLVRQGKLQNAVPYLRDAARNDPSNPRYSYVYAVALWETGSREEAVTELESALARLPGNRDLTGALASYYRELGEEEKLRQLMQP